MAVAFDAVGPNSSGAGTSGTTKASSASWSHTCTGSNLVLLVGVTLGVDPDTMTTAVTYDGTAMTSVAKVHSNNTTAGYVQLFALTNPSAGANTVAVTLTGGTATISAGSVSFTGASGVGTPVTAVGSSGTPSVTVTGTTSGNMVVDALADGSTIASSSQTMRWNKDTNTITAGGNGAQSTAAAGGSVTMSYTAGSDWWGIIAVEVLAGATTVDKNASDSGTGTDTATVLAPKTATDSGTGSDSAGIAIPVSATDSGIGTDSGFAGIPVPASDTSSGSETVSTTAALAASDSRTGSDTAGVGAHLNAGTDSGTGTDAALIGIPAHDTGTGLPETVSLVGHLGVPDTATGADGAVVETLFGDLVVSLYGIDPDTGDAYALPDYTSLTLSPVRNSAGSITLDYPADGLNFDRLRGFVDDGRDLEIEIWTFGSTEGAMRGYLNEASFDDVAEDRAGTFAGGFLESRMAEMEIEPQEGAEKAEFIISAKNPGEIMTTLLGQAHDRGVAADITAGFTTTHDSAGNVWPADRDITTKFSPSTSYDAVLNKLVSYGLIEWAVTWTGTAKQLDMWIPEGRGTDLTLGLRPVVFRHGRNILDAPRKYSVRDSATAVLAAGAEGLYEWAVDATAEARRGRRIEASVSANNMSDPGSVTAFANAQLAALTPEVLEINHGIGFLPGEPRPVIAFNIGDWVYSQTGPSDDADELDRLRYRVVQWTLTVDAKQNPSGTVTLNDTVQDALVRLRDRLNAIADGNTVVGTSEPPNEDDTMPPAAPTGVVAGSEYYPGVDGQPLAAVTVGWSAVTTNQDGTPTTDVAGYRIRHRVVLGPGGLPGPWMVHHDVTGLSDSFSDAEGGIDLDVAVQAFDRVGNASEWSATVRFTTETDTTPPAMPSTPVVTAYLGQLKVAWDGLSSVGGPMPLDLARVEVHVDEGDAFTPSDATLKDEFRFIAGERVITDLPYGGITQFVRLVAVDRSENRSDPSATASAIPAQVVSADIFDGAVGSLKLADLAVTTAKINLLAVNDAQIGSASVGKLTAGTLTVAVTNAGIIRTNTTGMRTEQDAAGFRQYNAANALTVNLNGASNLISGTIKSALSGKRWEMQPDGSMRYYHVSGDYSQLTSYDSYDGSAVMWRAPLDGSGFSGRISVTTIGVNLSFSEETDLFQLRSEILLRRQDVMITSPLIQFKANREYAVNPTLGGSQRIVFMFKNSSGIDIADTILYFQTAPSDQPWFAAPFTNSGLCFDTHALVCQDGGRAAIPIGASAFNNISTRTAKFDINPMPFSALHVVRTAAASAWRYRDDAKPRPERPDVGPDVLDPDVPFEWGHEQKPAPLHFGPMAEDLAAISPDLVTEMSGRPATDVRDLLGWAWAAIGELAEQVDRLKGDRGE